jgi:hypothetical protein
LKNSNIITESCYFINNANCYDVVKDFSGPIITLAAAAFAVIWAFVQLNKQHQNKLNAQKNETKRNTKIKLFQDISQLLDQASIPIRQANSYCLSKKYSSSNQVALLDGLEYTELSQSINQALLSVVAKVESHEIINPLLFKTFRYSLQSIVHDIIELRHITVSTEILDKLMACISDANLYLQDFQVCMQNLAYGEVFDSSIPARVPVDKKLKVITNDKESLNELLHYFTYESNWGVACKKLEKEAHAKFSS